MVNQKAISVRLDYDVLQIVDQEAFITGIPRNRLINEAIKLYVALADAKRRFAMYNEQQDFNRHIHALGLKESLLQ